MCAITNSHYYSCHLLSNERNELAITIEKDKSTIVHSEADNFYN